MAAINQRVWTATTSASLLLLLSLAGCGGGDAEGAEDTPALTVGPESIVVVGTEEIHSGPVISGTLEAEEVASVRAEIGGSILQTNAEEGQSVAAGQPLARIDDNAVQDAYLSAQSGVRSAENSLNVAQREVTRAERLVEGGAIAARELELARNQLAAAQAQVADALARQAQASRQLEATRVRSPIQGIISEKAVNAGDVVTPGASLFTVIDPSRMRLEAAVPSDQLGALRIGAPVQFQIRGYPGASFQGTIERINPAADPVTRQVPIYVSVPNVGGRLVAGLFAEGQVRQETRSTTVVPASAVEETGTDAFVIRLKGGIAERVQVSLGVRDRQTEQIEVLTGVSTGDTLLIGAARAITPGTPVRVGTMTPAAAPVDTVE